MGAIANTRGSVEMLAVTKPIHPSVHFRLGDEEFKPVGVTPEPEVKRRVLTGSSYCVCHGCGIYASLNRKRLGIPCLRVGRYYLYGK